MSQKKTPSLIAEDPDYVDLQRRLGVLKKEVRAMEKAQRASGESGPADAGTEDKENRKREKAERRFDEVVATNVFADVHRLLTDRVDIDFTAPASLNANDPAEVTRRAAVAVLEDMADDVAVKWRDFEPEAGHWSGKTAKEARHEMIWQVRSMIEDEFPPHEDGRKRTAALSGRESSIAEEITGFYEESRDPDRLPAAEMQRAVKAGILQAKQVAFDVFDELAMDCPSVTHPQAHIVRDGAIADVWSMVARHVQQHVPEDVELPVAPAEHYRLCYLDVAQTALSHAFHLAALGTKDNSEVPEEPYLFAGAILTQMGLPQQYVDPELDEEELVAMYGEDARDPDFEAPPTPSNGELAESPRAVQQRELMLVVQTISESLAAGALRKEVKRQFNKQGRDFAGSEESRFSSIEEAALAYTHPGVLPRKPLVSKEEKAAGWGAAADMLDEILGDMMVEIKASDGYVVDRSQLKTPQDKMEFGLSEPKFRVIPSARTLQ